MVVVVLRTGFGKVMPKQTPLPYRRFVQPSGQQALRYNVEFGERHQRFEIINERLEPKIADQGAPYIELVENAHKALIRQVGQFGPTFGVLPTNAPMVGMIGGDRTTLPAFAAALRGQVLYSIDRSKSVLAQVKDAEHYPDLTYLAKDLERIRLYREWTFGRNNVVRSLQKTDLPNANLAEDHTNLGLVLNRLSMDYEIRKRIVEALRRLYEDISDFHVNIEFNTAQLFVQERGGQVTVPATRLSDGTIRYFFPVGHPLRPTAAAAGVHRGAGTRPASRHPPRLGQAPAGSIRTLPDHRHHTLGNSCRCLDAPARVHRRLREGRRTNEAQTPKPLRTETLAGQVSIGRAVVFRRDRGEPLVKVRLYVEGGGDGRALRQALREGFRAFFEKAGLERLPRVVACGSRRHAYDDFRATIGRPSVDFVALLVDSEGPVSAATSWAHLKERDGWERPAGAAEKNVHLMVQVMESWFLADRDCLARYFGQGFRASALPAVQRDIEDVAKEDVGRVLNESTHRSRKGRYAKGRDSFELLKQVDAAKVIKASPHARRLVRALADAMSGDHA